MKNASLGLITACILLLSTVINAQTPKIEYIAHAAFVIESSQGTRVVIDPYHSYRQMGFTFPEDITTDLVLITHPHYDHDGSQYFSKNTPVFRDAGIYQYKDVMYKGIASNHTYAQQIGKSGNQNYNTIWIVEVDGIKIAHLGDNEVPTPEEIQQLSDVDYIIGHPQDTYLTLFPNTTYIPNHYLLPEITSHKNWMQPVSGWLEGKKDVVKLTTNIYKPIKNDTSARILVFKPSTKVQEWSKEYYEALASIKEGLELQKASENFEAVLVAYDRAIKLAPYVMDGYYNKAVLLSRKQKHKEVISVLEKGFTAVSDIDWGTEANARTILAEAYLATDQMSQAYNQYVWLNRHDRVVNKNTLKIAQDFIKKYLKEN